MTTRRWFKSAALCAVPLTMGVTLGQCNGLKSQDFVQINENGFDADDHARDINEYPWSMTYFKADGADEGYVYVGTGNGIMDLGAHRFGALPDFNFPPCEIRRHRPDLGPKAWERVFDYRDVSEGPSYPSNGFRNMTVYEAQSDGVRYIYAGTFGLEPAIWRSASGDPETWEKVWTWDLEGSVRWMAEHDDGLLYIGLSNVLLSDPVPGQVWATDGEAFWPVVDDGFGNPNNIAAISLVSYGGWMYAGTSNVIDGYEIWRFAGPNGEGPELVVDSGGPDQRNQSATTPYVFQGKLYWGSIIFGGFKFKGADLIRIHEDASWEVIVGQDGLSGYGSGFDDPTNAYIWWMEEHDGVLYASTWDVAGLYQYLADNPERVVNDLPEIWGNLPDLLELFRNARGNLPPLTKRDPTVLSRVTQAGAALYKSADGVNWTPVFKDGLGDPYNWGVRTMVSADGFLYLGLTNSIDGLEIWRGATRPATDLE